MINPLEDNEYFLKELAKGLADMPRLVRKKSSDFKKRQKFLKRVWGKAIRQLERELARKKLQK